jgi:hypothetical protein
VVSQGSVNDPLFVCEVHIAILVGFHAHHQVGLACSLRWKQKYVAQPLELDISLTVYSSLFVIVSTASPTLPSRNFRQSSEKSSTLRPHCRRYCALYNGLGTPERRYVAFHLFNSTISVLYIDHMGCSGAKRAGPC